MSHERKRFWVLRNVLISFCDDGAGNTDEGMMGLADTAPKVHNIKHTSPPAIAILDKAGVKIALISDDPVQDSRLLLRTGGLAVRGGLSTESALRALTLTPAEMIGLSDRIGSLEVGKEADLVVLSGPPLSTWSLVQQTWNNGAVVFDRATDAAHATGGDERVP